MAMDIQRQIADLKAAAPNSLTYTPVPLPNDDRSTRQKRHIELFSNECDNSPSSNKVADTDFVEFGGISEDEIKKSLMVEVKRRKFWNAKTIEKMTFEEVINTACYHYLLESFTESRCTGDVIDSSKSTSSSALTHENFGHTSTFNTVASSNIEFTSDCGTARISSAAGNAAFSSDFGQNPWDFDVQPDEEFVNQIKVLEMPNSHRMATCRYCNGKSLVHCSHCSGRGTDKCTYCRGTGMRAGVAHPALYTHPMIGNFPGHNHSPCGTSAMGRGYPFSNSAMIRPALLGAQRDKPYAAGTPVHFMAKAGLPPPGIGQHDICIFCHGRGICDCQHCKGQCKKNCMTCSGTGQVPVFTKLKVAFAVECTDYYTSCEVPELMLRQATGELIFSETRPYVQPIRKHQIKEINEISKRFCATHLKKLLDSCRVLKQRHCIERIEVAKVRFRLGSKIGHFFVFGKQRLCFIPKGSASSNCSVM